MQDDEFEWDDDKAASNLRKHDVSFETAREAFRDAKFYDEDEPDPDESRFRRICLVRSRVYVVVYTERAHRIRIISARRADRHEQRKYFSP